MVYSEESLNLWVAPEGEEEYWEPEHSHDDPDCNCECYYDEYEGFGHLTIQTDKPLIISNKNPEESIYGGIYIHSDYDITLKNIDINGYVNINSNSGVFALEGDNRIYDSYHGGELSGTIDLNNNSLEIKGDGKLTLESTGIVAIYSQIYESSLVISGGTLDLKGTQYGIYIPNITINGGDVTATGDLSAIGYTCAGSITINDGTVTSIGKRVFDNCPDLIKINLPCNWDDSIYQFDKSVKTIVHKSNGSTTKSEKCTVCGYTIAPSKSGENNNDSLDSSSSEIGNGDLGLTYDHIIVVDGKDHTDENDFAAGECVKVEEIVIM